MTLALALSTASCGGPETAPGQVIASQVGCLDGPYYDEGAWTGSCPAAQKQFAADESGAYLVTYVDISGEWSLQGVPLEGGQPTTLLAGQESGWATDDRPAVLALGDSNVYFNGPMGGIVRIPKTGGTPVPVLALGDGLEVNDIRGLVATSDYLLWISPTSPQSSTGTPPGTLWALPLSKAGQPGASIELASDLPDPCAIAVDTDSVYWIDCTLGELQKLPIAGGPGANAVVLASGLDMLRGIFAPVGLAVAAGRVFWGETRGGAIRSVATTGGAPVTIDPNVRQTPSMIFSDGSEVYWLDSTGFNSVLAAPVNGGDTKVLVDWTQADTASIGITAKYLVLEDNATATVRRIPR